MYVYSILYNELIEKPVLLNCNSHSIRFVRYLIYQLFKKVCFRNACTWRMTEVFVIKERKRSAIDVYVFRMISLQLSKSGLLEGSCTWLYSWCRLLHSLICSLYVILNAIECLQLLFCMRSGYFSQLFVSLKSTKREQHQCKNTTVDKRKDITCN